MELRNKRVLGAFLATALLAAPVGAIAQDGLQNFFANAGLGGMFEVHEEPHTIVLVKEPKHYQICNTFHRDQNGDRATITVNADGEEVTIAEGHCTDVEATKITVVSSTAGATAYGTYRNVD